MTSLPTPVSPVRSTVDGLDAARSTSFETSFMAMLFAISRGFESVQAVAQLVEGGPAEHHLTRTDPDSRSFLPSLMLPLAV